MSGAVTMNSGEKLLIVKADDFNNFNSIGET